MTLSYRLLRAMISILFRLCTQYQVTGLENAPPGGPLIVVVNHIHTLDTLAAMASMPWQVITFAARKWQRGARGLFLRLVGVIFINRGEVDRQALRRAVAVLERGGILGLAPEGTRSPTRQLQPARGGVAYLAHLSPAPILPVAVTGVEHAIPSLLRLRRARVQVTVGRPFALPALDHKPKADELLDQADLVMRHIAELLPREYRGVYADVGSPLRRTPAPQG